MLRLNISKEQIESGIDKLRKILYESREKHGYGSFYSRQEIKGVIDEEFDEYKDNVHNSIDGTLELYDIAVAALFGAICTENKTLAR